VQCFAIAPYAKLSGTVGRHREALRRLLAEERWIDMPLENNVVEANFWKAVYNGCKIR